MKLMGALLTSLALSACNARYDVSASDFGEVQAPIERLASDDARARGRVLYRNKCALCHGERADGNGVRTKGLSGKPINFQSKEWRASTEPLALFDILSEGKRGTSMPAWPTLSADEKWDLIAYVLSVAEDGP
jgi:mono/diheme cytochrome c family protein